MDLTTFFASNIFIWVILPLLIFLARIIDVSLGTMRVIFIARGYKLMAPLYGFFEVFIWLLAIRQVLIGLSHPLYLLVYALGFSAGTYIGMVIEEKLSIGNVIIRVVTRRNAKILVRKLKERFRTTNIEASGKRGKVMVIYIVLSRSRVKEAIGMIKNYNPKSFYTIEDIRHISEEARPTLHPRPEHTFSFFRKGK